MAGPTEEFVHKGVRYEVTLYDDGAFEMSRDGTKVLIKPVEQFNPFQVEFEGDGQLVDSLDAAIEWAHDKITEQHERTFRGAMARKEIEQFFRVL